MGNLSAHNVWRRWSTCVATRASPHTHTERRCIVDTLYNTRPRSANFPKRIPQSQNCRCRPPHSAAVSAARQPCRVCRWRMGETIDLFSFAPVLCRQRERDAASSTSFRMYEDGGLGEMFFLSRDSVCVCARRQQSTSRTRKPVFGPLDLFVSVVRVYFPPLSPPCISQIGSGGWRRVERDKV